MRELIEKNMYGNQISWEDFFSLKGCKGFSGLVYTYSILNTTSVQKDMQLWVACQIKLFTFD